MTVRREGLSADLVWITGPLLALLVITGLLSFVPPSGPRVQVRWRDTVSAGQRQMFERRLHLVNPTFVQGTSWGYILGDPSPSTVGLLASSQAINDVDFIAGDPPRSTGPFILRMAGPLTVQSYVCLVLGLFMLMGSAAPSVAWRRVYFAGACLLFLVAWIKCQLPVEAGHEVAAWMGDYTTYTEDRAHFEGYFGYEAVRFHLHLGGFVLNLIDRALGSTQSSPAQAFLVMSRLAGCAFLIGAFLVAVLYEWSPQVMRYLALSMAAPFMLSYFGYREVGYLSISVAAFPLLLRGLTTTDDTRRYGYLSATGVTQGLHAALYGFGLVGLGGSLLAALGSKGTFRARLSSASTLFAWGFSSCLIWLLFYILVLGRSVNPGHAAGIPFRLLEPYVAESRIVSPVLSTTGLRDIGFESVIVGLPLLALGLFVPRDAGERRIAAAFSTVSVALLILFWPAHGIGMDTDAVFSVFPAVFAGAWLCSRSPRASGIGLCLWGIGHVAYWYVVQNAEFLNRAA